MSLQTNSHKLKIIQFKDIVSILLVALFIFFTLTGVLGNLNNNPSFSNSNKKITTRNLAMFASIAYADLENIKNYPITMDTNNLSNIINKDTLTLNSIDKIKPNSLTFKEMNIVTDEQLKSIKTNTTLLGIPLSDEEENTYSYLFYNLASTNEVSDWKLVNYTKYRTTIIKGIAEFTAMTFKKGNNIVIAYRGTDFDDPGYWIQDGKYMLLGYAGQEDVAQDYAKAVANYYKTQNSNINIYVTGHSLGGYLAQIGGAALVGDNNLVNNVKEISYFNGMGLNFWSNLLNKLNLNILKSKLNISKETLQKLTNKNSKLNSTQYIVEQHLTNWYNSGGKLISHNIKGDIISAAGTHCGEQKSYYAYSSCIKHHNGNQPYTNVISTIAFKLIKPFISTDISIYVNKYRPKDILDYIWITHETDSFFGVLDTRLTPKIELKFNIPSTIKRNGNETAVLIVNTIGGDLKSTKLAKSNLKISNRKSLEIKDILGPITKKTSTGYQYEYIIKLKGGSIIGYSNITLEPNVLKLIPYNTNLSLISNDVITTENIRTKLIY